MESLPQKTPGSWGPGQSKSDHKFFGSQNSAAPGILEFWRPNTPKETNSGISHWKIGRITKRTRILSSNHIFSGVNLLLVSGRVSISTFNAPLLTTYIPENSRISPLKKKWLVQMYFLLKNSPFLGGHTSFRGVFITKVFCDESSHEDNRGWNLGSSQVLISWGHYITNPNKAWFL